MAASAEMPFREVTERLVDHGIAAAQAFGRDDLAARLRLLGDRARAAAARVMVVGEFKQGKTSLVNAIAASRVLPVDPDAATVVPVAVHYSEEPYAVAVAPATDDQAGEREARWPIEITALRDWVVEPPAHPEAAQVRAVEVGIPAAPLRPGLALVDLPGVGGLGSFTGAMALASLPATDGVLFVSDAAQELTATEVDFLQRLAHGSVPVALVKSRTDIHPDWRRVLVADAQHAAPHVRACFGVSSEVWMKGDASDDDELRAESAIPDLTAWLRIAVADGAQLARVRAVADAVEEVAAQLAAPLEAERAALGAGEGAATLTDALERAQRHAARLRSAAGRWHQVLSDVFSDLANDADHGLRAAAREALAHADAVIDAADPLKIWEQYEPELRREVAGLVADHLDELHARVDAAATQVAAVFSDDASTIGALVEQASAAIRTPGTSARGDPLALADLRRRTIGGQALVLLRSSYGGALMAGFLGGIVGLALATPAVLAVGVALGTKGLREENERQLTLRRSQAKTVVRRFVDDVLFEVGKDSRDTVRRAQRHLRDFFAARAAELAASADAAVEAAHSAAARDAASRDARRHDIDAEVERLAWLVERCRSVRQALDGAERDR